MKNKTNRKRKIPKQNRSVKTRELIFGGTLAILDDIGIDGLSTNKIAERCGISITSIYHQFSDKYAILEEIHEKWLNSVLEEMDEFADDALNSMSWPEFFSMIGDIGQVGWLNTRQQKELWAAADSIPKLKSFRSEYTRSVTKRLISYMEHYGADGQKYGLQSVAITINQLHELELFPPIEMSDHDHESLCRLIRDSQFQLLLNSGLESPERAE